MNNILKNMSATIKQVYTLVEEKYGKDIINPHAMNISSHLSLVSAKSILSTVVSVAMLASVVPEANAQTQSNESNNEATGRVIGGISGAVIGNVMTRKASKLKQVAGILGMAYIGQAAGAAIAGKSNPSTEVLNNSQRDYKVNPPDASYCPTHLSLSNYNKAIMDASASSPRIIQGCKTLDDQTHSRLYSLMIDTVAYRAVAKLANQDLDAAEDAKAMYPNDRRRIEEFNTANRIYNQVFKAYADDYRQVNYLISFKHDSGFDVQAQQVMMSVVPGDIRKELGAPIHWPGVDDRIQEIGNKMLMKQNLSYSDLKIQSEYQRNVNQERNIFRE